MYNIQELEIGTIVKGKEIGKPKHSLNMRYKIVLCPNCPEGNNKRAVQSPNKRFKPEPKNISLCKKHFDQKPNIFNKEPMNSRNF